MYCISSLITLHMGDIIHCMHCGVLHVLLHVHSMLSSRLYYLEKSFGSAIGLLRNRDLPQSLTVGGCKLLPNEMAAC